MKRLRKRTRAFPSVGASPGTWPSRSLRRSRDDLFLEHSQKPPRGRQRDAHTRFGRLGSRIPQSSRENKTGRIKRNSSSPPALQISIVVVFVLWSSLVVWSLVAVSFLSSLSYPTLPFTCTKCLYRPSQSLGPRAPTKRARYREATSRLEFRPPPRPPPPSPLPHLARNPLSYVPVEPYACLRSRGRRDAMYNGPKYTKSRPISDNGTTRSDTRSPRGAADKQLLLY